MHDPVERSPSVPAGPVRAWLVEQLVRVLAAAVTVVAPAWRSARSQAGFVADQVRCRTGGGDPVDAHHATAVRELRPRALPPPLSHLEVLAGEDLDHVVSRVVALGRPDALVSPAPRSWAQPRLEDDVYVDDRRMAAALRFLDDEHVELVRRSS